MAVSRPAKNVIRFIAGDVDIMRGPARIIGIVIVGGSVAADLKLFDAANDATGTAAFEFGNVAIDTSDSPTIGRLEFAVGVSATLAGTGGIAYLYLD